MVASSLVFAGIAPHPPIMVPEVGGSASAEVRSSVDAMKELTDRLIASGAKTVVLISPHAPLESRAFVAYHGDKLHGDFASFGESKTSVDATLDKELLSSITKSALDRGYRVVNIGGLNLDHGTTVPLYFLLRNGWRGSVVALGYTFLSDRDHFVFGSCIRTAIEAQGKPVGVIASGDLSHRLKPGAPAGYNEHAHLFDNEIIAAVRESAPERIINIDSDLRATAGECGYRSMLVALGAADGMTPCYELLSYEAPFGVGYMVAQLVNEREKKIDSVAVPTDLGFLSGTSLAKRARAIVEAFILEGRKIEPTASGPGLGFRAACFVSIKTLSGDLRGCVGTVEPTKDSLEEELIANAINAATRDPRFSMVTPVELSGLRYSVDVLSGLEPATLEQLDPKLFGLVVEEVDGTRRGVLLPEIAGVESVEHQVSIATRKAGIAPETAVRYFRFRVLRFRESDQTK